MRTAVLLSSEPTDVICALILFVLLAGIGCSERAETAALPQPDPQAVQQVAKSITDDQARTDHVAPRTSTAESVTNPTNEVQRPDDPEVIAAIEKLGGRVYFWSRYSEQIVNWVNFSSLERNFSDEELAAVVPLLERLQELQNLTIRSTRLTPDGIAPLARLTGLWQLQIDDLSFTDEHLAALTPLTNLVFLRFSATGISDSGMKHFRAFRKLSFIDLQGSAVTDEGLVHLRALPKLGALNLNRTKVTGIGLDGLPDRMAVHLNQSGLNDAGLAVVVSTRPNILDLSETSITDAGVEHLKELKGLLQLNLSGTHVTEAGLSHLSGLTLLEGLGLNETKVTDAGLESLGALKRLRILGLKGTLLSGTGLEHLVHFQKLRVLDLGNTKITDEVLSQLVKMKQLESLDISGTDISEEGRVWLKQQLPRCEIHWHAESTADR